MHRGNHQLDEAKYDGDGINPNVNAKENDIHYCVVDPVVAVSSIGRDDRHMSAVLLKYITLQNLIEAAVFSRTSLLTILFWWDQSI